MCLFFHRPFDWRLQPVLLYIGVDTWSRWWCQCKSLRMNNLSKSRPTFQRYFGNSPIASRVYYCRPRRSWKNRIFGELSLELKLVKQCESLNCTLVISYRNWRNVDLRKFKFSKKMKIKKNSKKMKMFKKIENLRKNSKIYIIRYGKKYRSTIWPSKISE